MRSLKLIIQIQPLGSIVWLLLIVSMTVQATSCAKSRNYRRSNQKTAPNEQIEEIPGYLAEVREEAAENQPVKATLDETTVEVESGVVSENYAVRIRRIDDPAKIAPTVQINAVLGEPVQVDLYRGGSNELLPISSLNSNVQVSQNLSSNPTEGSQLFALMVINPGTSDQRKGHLTGQDLIFSQSDAAISLALAPAVKLDFRAVSFQLLIVESVEAPAEFISNLADQNQLGDECRPPSAPGNLMLDSYSVSLTSTPKFSWTASEGNCGGISHYEIAIGSEPGSTDVKDWTSVGSELFARVSDISLREAKNYYASVRAVANATENEGPRLFSSVSRSRPWTVCPTNYVFIPANSEVDVASDFCVMKYEAKQNASGIAVSQADETPWTSIARGADATATGGAWKACRQLGEGFDLISNAQWQAIARNIEGQSVNWLPNFIQSTANDGNAINTGFSELSPTINLAASDNDPCFGTGVTIGCATNPKKRTHTLSTGEIIWDIAGNAAEWVQGESPVNPNAGSAISQNNQWGVDRKIWGPKENYSAKNDGLWGGLGIVRDEFNSAQSGIIRGNSYKNDGNTVAGIFAFVYRADPETTDENLGFRCIYASP